MSKKSIRILLKLSGEMLTSPRFSTIDPTACQETAKAITTLRKNNYQIGIVIGGGNICRGGTFSELGMRRPVADHMGMLATMMNGLVLQEALIAHDSPTVIMSAIECPKIVESYHWDKAQKFLDAGFVTIFVGGTGNPYFTTDTAAALRASEIGAKLLLKATKVDGVFDKDPLRYPEAIFYKTISYSEVLAQKLQVMDATAVALCQNNELEIRVFNMKYLFADNFAELLSHGLLGSLIC